MSDILVEREKRSNKIKKLLNDFPIIISLKANIPGQDKNRFPAHLLVRLFSNLMKFEYECLRSLNESADGPFLIIPLTSGDPIQIKEQCIRIEDENSLGRFVDIDVYSLSQEHHRMTPRNCIVCHEFDSRICQKSERHTPEEVIKVIQDNTMSYLLQVVSQLIHESVLCELHLDPKFGLVTPTSSGSHSDMDYRLMLKAKDAILPYFIQMFEIGVLSNKSPIELMRDIREVGLQAERAMLKATGGVNAYKGLIFNLGFVVTAFGRALRLHLPFNTIFDELKLMAQPLISELDSTPVSFGLEAYHKYGIGGARKEMSLGLPSVQSVLSTMKDTDEHSLYIALVELIRSIEDTTLLKRADINTLYLIKQMFARIDLSDINEIRQVSEYCVENNLTFGGSADLLIVAVFLHKVRTLFFTSQDQ
ncbi:MAG: triphosphoribosyl-dephospho-CoA synthase [Firmicutes bacterium]|nr:triphosphoribosyl-dephospho-CoA synthase [Bacillota bacterium]